MQLLQPIFLVASLGILFPLAIHLWNRKKGSVVEMGSLRFLTELPKEQINSIELTQKRLLVLRSLIIICLVLLLTGLAIDRNTTKAKGTWILVEGELLKNPSFKKQLENYQSEQIAIYVIEDSLKQYNSEQEVNLQTSPELDYAELLSTIPYKQEAPDSIVVFTNGKSQNFSRIPKVALPITWVVSPQETETRKNKIVAARYSGKDSLKLIVAETQASLTAYRHKSVSLASLDIKRDTLVVQDDIQLPIDKAELTGSIIASDTNSRAVILLEAAFRTLSQYTSVPIHLKKETTLTSKEEFDVYFLVDTEVIPKELKGRNITLISSGNLALSTSLQAHSKGIYPKIYLDTKADQPSSNLLNLLAIQLFNIHKTFDLRRIDEAHINQFSSHSKQQANESLTVKKSSVFQYMNYILLGLGLFVFVIERIISSRR